MKKAFLISGLLNIILLVIIGYTLYTNEKNIETIKTDAKMATLRSVFGNYHKAKVSIFKAMPNDSNEIIFLGNSITDYCDWNELFGNQRIKNRGISADVISGVMNRLEEVTESHPEKIFIMIGINDLQRGRTVNQVLLDYSQLINRIIEETPGTKLYIQSLLPTKRPNLENTDVIEINKGLKEFSSKYGLTYINLFDVFRNENGEMNMNYSFDGLHPNGKGFLVWKEAINKYINQ